MKDVSTASKYRSHAYPKTRPTPLSMGVSKRKSPLANPGPRRQGLTPKALAKQQQLKLNMFAEPQISRAAQIAALGNLGKLLEEEYRTDVESYMHEMERQTMSSATSMDQQPEIRWHMRPCLVDFLLEVHLNFKLRPEVLYLACNIVDRYVSRRVVFVKHYQLVGCAALWIAAKFEEAKERVPTLRELHHICHQAYDETAFVQMEGHVLNTIGWCVGHPTAEAWLRVHCTGASFEDQQTQDIARFLMEITLYHREYVEHPPSAIAAAALILARHTVGKPRRPSSETEAALAVVDLLDSYLAAHVDDLSQTLVAKYSAAYYSRASTFIIQYYLGGRRFTRQPILPYIPVTPSRGHASQPLTPMSEADSDGPITPTTPAFHHAVATIATGKENVPSNNIFADVVAKLPSSTEDSTMYYPSPVITRKGSRPALHERNGVFSPVA